RGTERTKAVWVFVHGDDTARDAATLEAMRAAGARVRYVSRWLDAVSVDADAAVVRRLRRLPFVRALRPVGRLRIAGGAEGSLVTAPTASRAQTRDSVYYGANWSALRELGIPAVHSAGFTGEGVTIGIVDTGFEPRHQSFAGAQVARARDFIGNDAIVFDQA